MQRSSFSRLFVPVRGLRLSLAQPGLYTSVCLFLFLYTRLSRNAYSPPFRSGSLYLLRRVTLSGTILASSVSVSPFPLEGVLRPSRARDTVSFPALFIFVCKWLSRSSLFRLPAFFFARGCVALLSLPLGDPTTCTISARAGSACTHCRVRFFAKHFR